MRGHHFPSLEEVSGVVTQAIRGLDKSGTVNEIADLLKCWNTVIEELEAGLAGNRARLWNRYGSWHTASWASSWG